MKSVFFLVLLFISANVCNRLQAQTNIQDSLALVDLYNITNGPGWYHSSQWLKGPVESWYGIKVSNTRVIAIELYSNNLSGQIPRSLGNLQKLKYLYLGNNKLIGSIPAEIGNLANLLTLSLYDNDLSGSIPPALGKLSHLTDLLLYKNQLTGSFPVDLGNLFNLTRLDISSNKLSGSLPSSIGNLILLNTFSAYSNTFSGSIPIQLGKLTKLQYLYLYNNQFTGTIPAALGKLSLLLYLGLNVNQLSGSIPPQLGQLANLYYCNLGFNQLGGNIPAQLGNLTNLHTLYANNNLLKGGIPYTFDNLTNLGYLQLSSNKLSGTLAPSFGRLINLQYLYLDHNKLSGSIPAEIASLGLYELNLSHNYFTFDGMELIAKTFPFAIYDKQNRIDIKQNNNALSVSAGGTLRNNTYKWYNATEAGFISITADSVFHPLQSGVYYATVSNAVATQLILESDTLTYTLPAVKVTSNNAQLVKPGIPLFTAYPNPVKNTLYITANGYNIFSLYSLQGKVLSSANIHNFGSINVSGIVAGVYYLKNNKSKLVQQIVIIH